MLFDSIDLGGLALPNRVVMAPMTRCRADHRDAVPNDLITEYYRQRAGAGLIVSEGVPVSDRARGYINTPGIWNEAQAAGWRRVTGAVHDAGGRIFAQLWHCGRIAHSLLHADRSPPAGVSSRAAAGAKTFVPDPATGVAMVDCEAPQALTTEEARQIARDFGRAAELAKAAGFDGVQIHGANGYLFDQFRCPVLNDRSDEYGGSLENRYRLLLETVDAAAAVFGPGRVCVRQSPLGTFNDMAPDPDPVGTYGYIARELGRRGIGSLDLFDQAGSWIRNPADPLLKTIRDAFPGKLVLCGGFDRDSAEAVLAAGLADLVAFGRPYISNPDLVERMRRGAEIAPWQMETFYAGGEKGYTDYPVLA